jgi:hypothetical protein
MGVSAETFAHADCVSAPVGSSSESTALAAPATKTKYLVAHQESRSGLYNVD